MNTSNHVVNEVLAGCYISIINLKRRVDRREECRAELKEIGVLETEGAFFPAREVKNFGQLGCSLSHAMALSSFLYTSNSNYALILEDDFRFADAKVFPDLLQTILVDKRWDVFLLGHNVAVPVEKIDNTPFQRVVNAQTTSGYIVRRSYAPQLIETFFRSAELLRSIIGLPPGNFIHARRLYCCDILWKELQIKDRFFCTFPQIIQQRASFSDVENRFVDYKC